MLKNKKVETFAMVVLLLIQSAVFVFCGSNKAYYHMDEVYSYALCNYDVVQISEGKDFYDTWHTKDYFRDYVVLDESEANDYSAVYLQQVRDVHPPLYYLFLRLAMNFSVGSFSPWPGIVLNIVIYLFITPVLYLILKKVFAKQNHVKEKAMFIAFLSSVSLMGISNVIFIRMYPLLTLNILVTLYLHLILAEKKEVGPKFLVWIGLAALVGSLTHYYYIYYLLGMFLFFIFRYKKEKNTGMMKSYFLTMVFAAVASLLIFPFSVKHLFFSDRGMGTLGNLFLIPNHLDRIVDNLRLVHDYGFNGLFYYILVLIGILYLIQKNFKKQSDEVVLPKDSGHENVMKIVCIPAIVFFLISSISAPFVEIRYITPVGGLFFGVIACYLFEMLRMIPGKLPQRLVCLLLCALFCVLPVITKTEPVTTYSYRSGIYSKVKNELNNVPSIYCFDPADWAVVDSVPLLAELEQTYVTGNIDYSEENMRKILTGIDLSEGLLIFVNSNWDGDVILNVVKNVSGLQNAECLERLEYCDLYYLTAQ